MTGICPGSGYYPLPADRLPDGKAICSKCGQAVALSKSRHLFAHRLPEPLEDQP